MKFWGKVPPPMISLALIARANGAKFGDARPAFAGPGVTLEEASPEALAAFLGQTEPIPYQAPQKGLTIH